MISCQDLMLVMIYLSLSFGIFAVFDSDCKCPASTECRLRLFLVMMAIFLNFIVDILKNVINHDLNKLTFQGSVAHD